MIYRCFTDLDKLDMTKFAHGGLVLCSSQFLLLLQGDQNKLKNSHPVVGPNLWLTLFIDISKLKKTTIQSELQFSDCRIHWDLGIQTVYYVSVSVYGQGEGSWYKDKTSDLLYGQKDKMSVYQSITLCPDIQTPVCYILIKMCRQK